MFTYVLSQIIYECVLIDDATYNFKASFYNQTKENRMTSSLKALKYSSDGAVWNTSIYVYKEDYVDMIVKRFNFEMILFKSIVSIWLPFIVLQTEDQ